jgi:hypothetical protein
MRPHRRHWLLFGAAALANHHVFGQSNHNQEFRLRISAIVDGCFSLIVDGETASPGWRWGSAQALGLNVAQSSTISLKRAGVALVLGPVLRSG